MHSPAPCWPTTTLTFPTLAISRRSEQTVDQLTFLWEELPANHSASPDDEQDWMIRVATWPSNSVALLNDCAPAGFFGRTCPASLVVGQMRRKIQTAANGSQTILTPSSASWANAGMGPHGAFLTLNMPEYLNDAVASSLSAILETGDLPQRYFLSARACAGILRRALQRGKTLPTPLQQALEHVGTDNPRT